MNETTIIATPEFEEGWKTVAYLALASAIDAMQRDDWGAAATLVEGASAAIEGCCKPGTEEREE